MPALDSDSTGARRRSERGGVTGPGPPATPPRRAGGAGQKPGGRPRGRRGGRGCGRRHERVNHLGLRLLDHLLNLRDERVLRRRGTARGGAGHRCGGQRRLDGRRRVRVLPAVRRGVRHRPALVAQAPLPRVRARRVQTAGCVRAGVRHGRSPWSDGSFRWGSAPQHQQVVGGCQLIPGRAGRGERGAGCHPSGRAP